MTLSDYATYWQANVLGLKKPASRSSMASHLRRLCQVFGQKNLTDLTTRVLQEHITSVAQDLSPKSVKNYWATIRLVLGAAKREGLIAEIPEPDLPRVFRTQQDWLTPDQMRLLLHDCRSSLRAQLWLLAETGLRAGEFAGLRVSDVHFPDTLTVRESVFAGRTQAPKTEAAVRTISLSPQLVALLQPWVEAKAPEAFLFASRRGTPVNMGAMRARVLQPLQEALGLPKTGFHALRRGNISLCANVLGMPKPIIAMRVGHQLGDMTFGVYCRTSAGEDRPWAVKIGAELAKK